jgi:uncharacterized membrane protein (UPF0127 family)
MEFYKRLCYNQVMSLINNTQKTEVVCHLKRGETFWSRALGLLMRAPLQPGEGLWLAPCRWVHTLGMRSPIEVIYVNAQGIIVGMQTLPPNRFGQYTPQAWGVLEVPVGTWVQSRCCMGDELYTTAESLFHREVV